MLLTAAATDAMRDGTERITEEIIDGCTYKTGGIAAGHRPWLGGCLGASESFGRV